MLYINSLILIFIMIDDKYVNMLQEVGIISITVFIVVCAVLVAVGIAGAFMAFKYGYSYRRNFAEQSKR